MAEVANPHHPMVSSHLLFQHIHSSLSCLTSTLVANQQSFLTSYRQIQQQNGYVSTQPDTDPYYSRSPSEFPVPDLFPSNPDLQFSQGRLPFSPTMDQPEHDMSLASEPLLIASIFKLTRLMLFNFVATFSAQVANQMPQPNCERCIQSGLPLQPLSLFEPQHDHLMMEHPHHQHPLNIITPQNFEMFQNIHIQTEFQLNAIFSSLHQTLHIRQTEIIQSFALLFELCRLHWNCGSFAILRDNLLIVFLVCVLLAHKLSNDISYSNHSFATLFTLSLPVINEYERTIIFLLNYDLIVSPSSFMTTLHNLEQEFAFYCSLRPQ